MQASHRRSNDWTFWRQVVSAFSRIVALLMFLLAHKLINIALEWTVPASFAKAVLLIEAIAYGAFGVIYIALVVEMVAVFIPPVRRRMYPNEGSDG